MPGRTRFGGGKLNKAIVMGAKERGSKRVRARVVPTTKKQVAHQFVRETMDPDSVLLTDQNPSYQGAVGDHHAVNHSAYEYVRGMAHTNGIESFWATLKRAYKGTFHKLSHKHMSRYVNEFAGRHNVRDRDTLDQMATLTAAMVGKRIEYQTLVDSPRNYSLFDPSADGLIGADSTHVYKSQPRCRFFGPSAAERCTQPNDSTESGRRNLPNTGNDQRSHALRFVSLRSARLTGRGPAGLRRRHRKSRQAFGQEVEETFGIHVLKDPSVWSTAPPVYVAHRPSQGMLADKLDCNAHVPPLEQLRLQEICDHARIMQRRAVAIRSSGSRAVVLEHAANGECGRRPQ